MMISLPVVADDSFDAEVISSELPVLVDFWAPWCAPCKALGPIIEELSSFYSGRLKVLQMNVQDNKKIPVQFRIRSIPTLILFKGGKVVDQIIGQAPRNKIDQMIKKAL
jgi:thioredoxin 1